MLWSEAEGAVKVAVTACIVVLTLALVLWKVVAPVSVENGKGFAQDKNTMLHKKGQERTTKKLRVKKELEEKQKQVKEKDVPQKRKEEEEEVEVEVEEVKRKLEEEEEEEKRLVEEERKKKEQEEEEEKKRLQEEVKRVLEEQKRKREQEEEEEKRILEEEEQKKKKEEEEKKRLQEEEQRKKDEEERKDVVVPEPDMPKLYIKTKVEPKPVLTAEEQLQAVLSRGESIVMRESVKRWSSIFSKWSSIFSKTRILVLTTTRLLYLDEGMKVKGEFDLKPDWAVVTLLKGDKKFSIKTSFKGERVIKTPKAPSWVEAIKRVLGIEHIHSEGRQSIYRLSPKKT